MHLNIKEGRAEIPWKESAVCSYRYRILVYFFVANGIFIQNKIGASICWEYVVQRKEYFQN